MSEDEKMTAELSNDELEEVAGGIDLGNDGWPCIHCGSTNTNCTSGFVKSDGYWDYSYHCNNCGQDFAISGSYGNYSLV